MITPENIITDQEEFLRRWQTFSSHLSWAGLQIKNYSFPSMFMPPSTSSMHTALFNTGYPVKFSVKFNSGWKKYYCAHGSIVQLMSAGEISEMQWEGHFDALLISMAPTLLERLTEVKNFRFSDQVNINDTAIAGILSRVQEEIVKNNLSEKIYAESLVLTCVIHLACTYSGHGKKIFAPKGKLSAGQLKQVIDYSHANIRTNISLTQLAGCANLSAFHFARLFRQTMGISPYQFVLQMKIGYAKQLIRQHNGSISEVAYLLNFTDQAHFSNAFKKITGSCPRQFQQTSATLPI